MRTRTSLLLTIGIAVTLLALVGTTRSASVGTTRSASVVFSLVVPAMLGGGAGLMAWLGVLFTRRRRSGNPWSPSLMLLVGIEVLVFVAVGGFLFPRLPAIAPWTAVIAAIAAFVALVLKAAPTFGWDQDAHW